MVVAEMEHGTKEIWSLMENPIPPELVDVYIRYVNSLPPHTRVIRIDIPNPGNGHFEDKDLRSHLEERTLEGLFIAKQLHQATLNQLTSEEINAVRENPELLVQATITRLEKSTPDSSTHYW